VEVRAVGGVAGRGQQRGAASHDARVDRAHDERPDPGIEVGVEVRRDRIGMLAGARRHRPRRIEQKRIVDALGLVAIIRGRCNCNACEYARKADRLQF